MKNNTPTLKIKDLALLKSNPKNYYKKKLEEDTTIIDEETSTVKHPVTERARNIGATGKQSDIYTSGDKKYYDIEYRDGTKLTFQREGGDKGEWIGDHEESREFYIEADDDLLEAAEMAEPFAITDALEDEIRRQNPDLEEFYIDDEPEFDGDGFIVSATVTVDEYAETSEVKDSLVSVTTPDGETIDYLEDKGGQGWHEELTMPLTDDLKDTIENSPNGPFVGNALEDAASHNFPNYEDLWAGEITDVTDDTVTFYAEYTDVGYNKEGKGSIIGNLSGSDKTLYTNIKNDIMDKGIEAVKDKYSPEELEQFNNIVAENNLSNEKSFFTIRNMKELPEGEGVGKAIVQNKDYNIENISDNGEQMMKDKGEGWQIITIRETGNPANNGVSLGDGTFLTAQGQKNERYIIDEERKTIIQRPYKPGMDRHIWG